MDILNREGLSWLLFLALSGCTGASPRDRLERSLEAMGVTREPSAQEGLLFEARGTLDQGVENQGRYPGSHDPSDFRETLAVDVASERLAYEYRHDRRDGSEEWIRDFYDGDERTIVVRSEGFAVRLQSPDYVVERRSLWRRFPHLLLREALANDARLSAGDDDGIVIELASGEKLLLTLEPETSLPTRVDYTTDVQSLGDTRVSWSFGDYRPVEGFGLLPRSYRVTVAGRPFIDMEVTLATGQPNAWQKAFTLPDGMKTPDARRLPEGDAAARASIETVAPGVHIVRNLRLGFHPMFIELADTIVAIDASAGYRLLTELPAGDVAPGTSSAWLSERFIELIEQTVPDKPIGYVVLTHFHNDHAGGVRAFVAKGATVVGPAAIQDAVEGLVSAPHTVAPDALAGSPRELRYAAVADAGSLTLEGVEVIDVGPNPHSDAMLAIRIPSERILFTSDLVELESFFSEWLSDRGLSPERVFSMHAAEPTSGAAAPEEQP